MVKVAPLLVHPPEEVYATANPELEVAATVNLLLYAALAGAAVVTVIVWLVGVAATVSVSCGAAL